MSPGEDGLIGIPFPEHSNELLSRLNAQRRSGLLCDLTLTSRGARYPTHRAVMAAVSLYFRRLFGAEEVGEAGEVSEGCSVCQLDCVSPDALDALLEFAYTATLTIRSSGMREVLEGAQLLGIQCVADACRHILGEVGENDELGGEGGELSGGGELGVANKERASYAEKDQKTPSRRKQDRRNVEKASSPVRPAWNTQSQEDKPKCEAPPTLEHKPHPSQNGASQSAQQVALMNGGAHWHPQSVKEEESKPEGLTPPPNHTPSQAEIAVGGAVEGVARKRKSQAPQQCPVCQKIIHGAGKLPRHMRTHTGEKPFQCMTCGVRFTRNDKLKIHMRKHTGERPYSCPSCPARFLHSYDLKNHLSLHSGVRPFECPLCHKAFAREDHLQRHRKGLACLEPRPRLELRPRRAHHAASPHSPLSPPSLSPTSSSSTTPHFLFRQEVENPGTPSHGPLIPGGMAYLQWRLMEERGGTGWREDEEES
ncbi:zinc finger and BTB domain-containing protein 7B isoform X1 [Neoarius graeffei]|nr:zinc finger and BTB domain-containing protein 7B isoform X1 [Neoarius graeffei]XP_060776870.1 zinc finger and BTB domain-containing protein 7B isoform X1 [Neoarius graeffei]XP_060776871.1 zinc finger and BTB domain-containing protein 7B isoform X1 [Neoarius graeffei]XP_060776872.1 zinc finger and BTB domain-containing protein 7B isoform X1 [Neoarius graeffei]